MRERSKKTLRTRETYRYSHSGISASTVWSSSVAHLHCVCLVLAHHIARCSWVGVIPPMEPAIMGSRAGLREEGSVRVGGMVNRHTEIRVLAGATHHIRDNPVQPSNFRRVLGVSWVGFGGRVGGRRHCHRAMRTPTGSGRVHRCMGACISRLRAAVGWRDGWGDCAGVWCGYWPW